MFTNQMTETNMNHNVHKDDFDFYNLDGGHRFIVTWSPQEENKYFSRHTFASPRVLSKSVPRRSRSLMKYKINRSLNFDTVHNKNESTFKSPNSSSEKNCFEGTNQLSRSAKIMRALNFGHSPLYNHTRKIKKSLNFDLSPKPRRFTSSPQNVSKISLITPSPKLSRSLHFDSSPNDTNSTPSSVLLTSSESIDENQNQTPSQRNRKVKKSLNYLSPALEQNIHSSDMIIMTPLLRSDLKEKIDNIVQIGRTPNLHSFKKSTKKMKNRNDVNASTPRNLFHDFCEDENERPCTPENTIRIIPESMSAIKKSHKKDRLSRRLEHEISNATADPFTTEITDILQVGKRPSTPPITEKNRSPTYDVNSIKQSHKKDKTKRKVGIPHSEDEISDTGSIFEYCTEHEEDSQKNVTSESDKHEDAISLKDSSYGSEENSNHCLSNDDLQKHKDDEVLYHESDHVKESDGITENPPEMQASQSHSEGCPGELEINPIRVEPPNTDNRPRTPEISITSPNRTQRTNTPENHVNYLQRIMTESIKKSHKKVKDENRKKLFRPKNLHQKLESHQPDIVDHIDQDCLPDNTVGDCKPVEEDVNSVLEEMKRATTPENVNSSRLLLSQFNSVKKSHKKDKNTKIISGFKKRQKYQSKHNKSLPSVENRSHDSSMSSCDNDQKGSNVSDYGIHALDHIGGNVLNSGSIGNDSKLCLYQGTPSPGKRKKSSDSSLWSVASKGSNHPETISGEYESAEEEFKIFTPIKKRKPLPIHPRKHSNNAESSEEESINVATSRCITPVLNYHECLNSSDSDFQPIQNSGSEAENHENSASRRDEHNSPDPSGRQTPQNMSTAELLVHFNSIKKSHKKDKRGSDLRRQLAMNHEALSNEKEKEDFAGLPTLLVPSAHSSPNIKTYAGKLSQDAAPVDYDNPQPSTSKANIEHESVENMNNCSTETMNATPPNCFRAINYIKLLQTESIKRSHKKVRVQKKYSAMVDNSELSDDGSIFGDDEIAASFEESKLISSESTSILEDSERQVQNQPNIQIDSVNVFSTASNRSSSDEDKQTKFQRSECLNHGSPGDASF